MQIKCQGTGAHIQMPASSKRGRDSCDTQTAQVDISETGVMCAVFSDFEKYSICILQHVAAQLQHARFELLTHVYNDQDPRLSYHYTMDAQAISNSATYFNNGLPQFVPFFWASLSYHLSLSPL
jgi:hypothetical protein